MLDWWADHGPPVYVPVASYFGLNKGSKKKASNNLYEIFKYTGKGGMIQ